MAKLSTQSVIPMADGWFMVPELVGGYAFRCRLAPNGGWQMQGDRGSGWIDAPAPDVAWMLAAHDAVAAAAGMGLGAGDLARLLEMLRAALVNCGNVRKLGIPALTLVTMQVREALTMLGEPEESVRALEGVGR